MLHNLIWRKCSLPFCIGSLYCWFLCHLVMVLKIVLFIYFWVTHYPKTLKLKTAILFGCNTWVGDSRRPWLSGLFLIHGSSNWLPDVGDHNFKMISSFKCLVLQYSLISFPLHMAFSYLRPVRVACASHNMVVSG